MKHRAWLLLTTLITATSFAQIQTVAGKGAIDWGNRTVTAVGIGAPNPNMPEVTARPMAIRAARQVAMRNALELIKGIQMTSTTTVENFMITSDVIRTSVEGYIQSFKESEPKYMSDKTIEISVTIPLDNELAQSLLPPSVSANPSAVIQVPATAPKASFTGLIIDARGLGAVPALVPKVLNEDGKEIYGSAYVSREFAVKWGMAGYAKTVEQAAGFTDRVGSQPGVIKAIRATGASKSDLVLSNSDALSVQVAAKSMKFLSDCRIIIVVD